MYHNPVLLEKSIEALAIQPDGTYVDVTFGGGGHSQKILQSLGENGRLFAFDQDDEAARNKINDPRFTFIPQNFKYLKNFLLFYQATSADGIFADLGVSSHQFDSGERGFSTRFEGKLDMRMNRNQTLTCEEIVNTYTIEDLTFILKEYGELPNGYILARRIIEKRIESPIITTNDLKSVLEKYAERGRENKFFAKVFQAFRIAVNDEMGALQEMLLQTIDCLKVGGRLVVISYHSLEDRLVKNIMKSGNLKGEIHKDFFGNPLSPFKLIERKPISPSDDELEENSRSRSAKLRVAEKVEVIEKTINSVKTKRN